MPLNDWFSTIRDQQFGKLDTRTLAENLDKVYQTSNCQRLNNNFPRQVILITNTKPLDYRDVTKVINGAQTCQDDHNRTFTIGIDDVSMSLCEDISVGTGGKAEFCCNHETFFDCFQRQVSRAQSKPSYKLSKFNASISGIDPKAVRDPRDFTDSGFYSVELESHIFGGQPTIDIGSALNSRIAHIQTGFIINDIDDLKTYQPHVKLDIAIERLETGDCIQTADCTIRVRDRQSTK